MKSPVHLRGRRPARLAMCGGLVLGAGVVAAACGTTASGTAGGSSHAASPAAAGASSATSTSSGVTVGARAVAGFGTVLVNGQGRTLYLLTSEKGGKVTCTDASGCTKIWPDTELPRGVTAAKAGSGVNASLLGTVTTADGARYVTYNHWPLYTYAGDSAAGQAHGEGIVSFGGTWYLLNTAGNPVTRHGSSASTPASGGYGY